MDRFLLFLLLLLYHNLGRLLYRWLVLRFWVLLFPPHITIVDAFFSDFSGGWIAVLILRWRQALALFLSL
jgi:hypothetical protein